MQNQSHRKERLPELLQHLAAEFIQREAGSDSLITVTSSSLSSNGKQATIFFTTLPESKERSALDFLNRQKKNFADYIDSHAKIGRMPSIDFAIDTGEKNRQRIDFLLENDSEK